MRFYTNDEQLRVGFVLDREHKDLDLAFNELGKLILDTATEGILNAHDARSDPEGRVWDPLRESTVKKKHHTTIGIATGKTHLLDPDTWLQLPREIHRRECWIFVPKSDKRFWIVHGWQNGREIHGVKPRRLMGWTRAAQMNVAEIVKKAEFEAGS